MADITRTIEILFKGSNQVGTVISSVNSDLDSLNYNVAAAARPLADLSSAVIKLDAALASLAAAGLAYAYSESSKLQSAFTELKKVVGDNDEALSEAKVTAKDLSGIYGESAASVLESTANYVQAGFSIEESMQLARTGMDLVIAGGVAASQSSEILIATLKGFKAPAEDAGRLLDILNEVSNQYATDIQQLGVGMAGLSPIARTMGFTFEETAGILTPVIEVFRSGDEAAVALKTGLLRLLDDSKPVQEALASIGVSQRDANGELRSGKDILFDVATAFQGLDQNQKLFVTQQLVGIEQSARMVEVFDGLSKSTEITAVAMNAAGSAAKEVAERLKDPEVAVNRLVQGFKNLASSVGDDFQGAGTGAIDGITAVLNSLEDAVDEGMFDPLLDALNNFLEGVETDLERLAESLPEALEGVDYSGFLDALGDIKDAIGGLFDGIDLDKPETITAAIQKVVDTLESITRVSAGIGEVFVEIGGYVSGLIGWFNGLDGDTKELIGTISGLGAAITILSGPIGTVTGALKGMGSVIGVVASNPIVAGFAAVAAGVYGITQASNAAADAVAKWTNKNELAEESMRFAKEVDEDIARIYAEADKVGPAMESMGKSAYESNLAIVKSMGGASDSTEELTEEMRKLGILVEEKKTVNVDTKDAKKKFEELEVWVGDPDVEGPRQLITIQAEVDTTKVQKAKKEIDEIPAVKRLEIETDFEIARVKSQAETVQAALQFKAQVDIAQIEAGTEQIKAVATNISEIFKNTGDVMGNLFSSWDENASFSKVWAIQSALQEEQKSRSKALELQEKLTEAQVKYMNAQTERLKSKDASLVTITGDGLQPHLEAFMWEVLSAIQVRATREGLGQLLLGGLP